MKKQTGIIVGVLVVLLVIFGVWSYQRSHTSTNTSTSTTSETQNTTGTTGTGGNLYVGVTDASADISNVNDVNLSVTKVELHSPTVGWSTVSSQSKTYGLLALKASGKTELYAKESNVPEGAYDKVRVTMGGAAVNTKSSGTLDATMPSSQIVLNTLIKVSDNQDTDFKLDFAADKSLHLTSDGKYLFAPVVNAEARSNATITAGEGDTLNISGGSVDSNTNVGMDLDGSSRANFILKTDNTLKITPATLGGQLNFMLGGKTYVRDDSKVQESEIMSTNNSGVNINTNVTGGIKVQ